MDLLRGVLCVRPVRRIKVYSRDPRHRESFAEKAASMLRVAVSPASSPADVIKGSEILLVATNSKGPVFDPASIEDGLLIASMGRPCEIDPAVYQRANLTVVGDEEQELNLDLTGGFTNPLLGLKEDKGFWQGVRELGEVVCGRVGRRSDDTVTVFRDSQGGWGDLALAQRVLTRAKEAGLGKEVSF
jgi:ornithine cyclodeaminase/alanine dehydrogenase-like protein (mu-crystallin family)